MATITLKGKDIHTSGDLPKTGTPAPDFTLTKTDLTDVSLKDYKGSRIVLNIFPSIDTSVCSNSVRKFNAEASSLENTVILCISRDLPYAHKRFCGAEGLDKVISLSELRDDSFSRAYGVRITDGPMAGLLARAVVVIDENGNIIYTQQVPDIGMEPDYESALKMIR